MKRIILLSMVGLLLTACQDNPEAVQPGAPMPEQKQANVDVVHQTTNLEELRQQLDHLTANKQCSTDSVCRVIPVGKRACGGPSSFAIFSTEYSNSEQVEAISTQITALEHAHNTATNAMSICEHLSTPAVQCIANTCTASNGPNPAF